MLQGAQAGWFSHTPPPRRARHHAFLERSASGGSSRGARRGGDVRSRLAERSLVIPDGHPFTSPLPIERLTPQLEISAPASAGWLKKELKMRPQRLERFALTDLVDDGERVVLKLRADVGSDQGFDFDVNPKSGEVSASRTTKEGGARTARSRCRPRTRPSWCLSPRRSGARSRRSRGGASWSRRSGRGLPRAPGVRGGGRAPRRGDGGDGARDRAGTR